MEGKPFRGFGFYESSKDYYDYYDCYDFYSSNSHEPPFPSYTGQQQQQPDYTQFSFNYSQENFYSQAGEPYQDSNRESFDPNYYHYSYPYSYSYEPAIVYGHTENKIRNICEFFGELIDGWEHRIQDCVYEGIVTTEDGEILDKVICEVKRVVSTENLTDPLLFYLFDPVECVYIEEESIQLHNSSQKNQPSQSSAAHWQPLFEHSNSNSDNIVIIEDVEDSEFDFESNSEREKDWEVVNANDDGGNGASNNHVFLNIPTLSTDEHYTGVESKSDANFNSPFQGYHPSAASQNEYSSVFENECFLNPPIDTADSPFSFVINTADSLPLPSSFNPSPNSFIYSPNLSIVEETEEKEEVIPFASPVSPVLGQSTPVEDFLFASIPFDAFESEETEVDENTNSNLNSKSSVRNSKFSHLFFPTSEDDNSHGKGDERMNTEASYRTSNGANEESKDGVNSSSSTLKATLRCSSSESEMNSSALLQGTSIILDSDDTSALKSCPLIDESIAFQEIFKEPSASNPSTERYPADENPSNHISKISDEFTQKTVQSSCSDRLESILSNSNASSVSDDEKHENNIPSFDVSSAVISSETSSEIEYSPTPLSVDSSSPQPFFVESSSAGASFQASRSVPATDRNLLSSFEDAVNESGLIPNSEIKESPLVELNSNSKSHETLPFKLEISSPAHTPATESIDHSYSIPNEELSDFALSPFPEFKLNRSRFCFAREENQHTDDAIGLPSTPHSISTTRSNSNFCFAQEENQHTDDAVAGLLSSHNVSTPKSILKFCFSQEENQPADDAVAGLLSTPHNLSTRSNSKFCFAQQTMESESSEMNSRDTSNFSFATVSAPCEKISNFGFTRPSFPEFELTRSRFRFAREENQPADDASAAGLLSTTHNVSTPRSNSKFYFAQQTVEFESSEMHSRDTSASSFATLSSPCEMNVESDMEEQMLGIQLEMDVNRVVEDVECSMNEQKHEQQKHEQQKHVQQKYEEQNLKEEKDKQQIREQQKHGQQKYEQGKNEQGNNEQVEHEQQRGCEMGRQKISFPLLTIDSRTTSLSSNPSSLEGNYPSDSNCPLSSALHPPPYSKGLMDEDESSVQIPFASLCELDALLPCGFGMEASSSTPETTNFESCERTCREILCSTLKLSGSTSIANPTISSLTAGNSAVVSVALAAYGSEKDNEASSFSTKTPLTYAKNARTRALSRASPISCIKNIKKEILNVEKQKPNAISSLHTTTIRKKGSNESNEKKPSWNGAWNHIRSWMFSL